MKKTHILVAEDDQHIREGLADALESEGYDVTAVTDGSSVLATFTKGTYHLVILDIMMPGQSGYEVCKDVRKIDKQIPIMMLTAKSEEIDKVVGLKLGADDYVTKPFGVHELLARVEALLRRAHIATPAPKDKSLTDNYEFGKAIINRKQMISQVNSVNHTLTSRELTLLDYFYTHPDEVLSRDDLLNAAWGIDYQGTTRTLDQHIAQLRKKVETDPKNPVAIITVHGIGYKYSSVVVRGNT